jgi:hypothetical protein
MVRHRNHYLLIIELNAAENICESQMHPFFVGVDPSIAHIVAVKVGQTHRLKIKKANPTPTI